MPNDSYQEKFFNLLPNAMKEEYEKLQNEYKDFQNHCNNFFQNVEKNFNEKLG